MRVLRWIVAVVLGLSGSVVAAQQPAAAADPACWTTFDPPNPAPGQAFGITYRNCAPVTLSFAPYFTNGSSVWVYEGRCTKLAYMDWTSWYSFTATPGLTFGVANCSPYGTVGSEELFEASSSDPYPPCYTSWAPPNVGPNADMFQHYRNCAGVRVRVAPAYRDANGSLWAYTDQYSAEVMEVPGADGCVDVPAPGLSEGEGYLDTWASWGLRTPRTWASYLTVFCV
jgi:hypothetical protein